MGNVKHWSADIYIGEDGRTTHAEARLHTSDTDTLKGAGDAHRHPGDRDVPEVGDEYAVGRALVDLGHKLISLATDEVEGLTPGHGVPLR